jgi:hypothetical protein
MLLAAAVIVINFVVDVLYAWSTRGCGGTRHERIPPWGDRRAAPQGAHMSVAGPLPRRSFPLGGTGARRRRGLT